MLKEVFTVLWWPFALSVVHCGLFVAPHYAAIWIRFQGAIPRWYQTVFWETAPWLILCAILVFAALRIFRRREAWPGVWVLRGRDLVLGSAASGAVIYALIYKYHGLGFDDYPRSAPLLGSVLLLLVLGVLHEGPSLVRRVAERFRAILLGTMGFLHALGHRPSGRFTHAYEPGVVLFAGIGLAINVATKTTITLPYDNKNPIVYDNDEVIDVYTDDYLMALASAGEIDLRGMITSSFDEKKKKDRVTGVRYARAAGFRHIPDPTAGAKGLERPSSGRIEDTKPLGSPGSHVIVNEAKKAQPENPLVVIMGGPLTVVADAYLLDQSVAENLIVAWLGGTMTDMADYNGWADPWAAYIVLQRLKLVQFPAVATGKHAAPVVPKPRLYELPESDLRQWMIAKQGPTGTLPDDRDVDAPPAIALMRGDYVQEVKTVSFSHWITRKEREQPAFKDDPEGTAIVVTKASRTVATEEWWRAMKNPAAWAAAAN